MLPDHYFQKLKALVLEYNSAADSGHGSELGLIQHEIVEIILAHMPNIIKEIEASRANGVAHANVTPTLVCKDNAYLGRVVAVVRGYAEKSREKYKTEVPVVADVLTEIIDYIDSELEDNK